MNYIDVAEWGPEQVTDWLKGLDDSMHKYIHSFANNEIKGQTLLNIRPYELEELGIASIGHQEIVLEAVEQLRSFNYDLEKENLQYLASRVATMAKNLKNQLEKYPDKSKDRIETQELSDITRAIATIKALVAWLDRPPFLGQQQFNETRIRISKLGAQMAASAQRDRFVENPVDHIRLRAQILAKLADYIIQDISDPLVLQPATLNVVKLKKRESELGFNIVPNYHGIHVITDIKYNSPAHVSGKIEDGDEIIQINCQIVVGWDFKRVLQQLEESPPDVQLRLKKRPRHTKIYGQIYMKPYRLPSKKRSLPYRFNENLPSPRIELIPSQNFPMLMPLPEKNNLSDTDSSSASSISIPAESIKTNDKDLRLYLSKPRAVLQRRNTICGDPASGIRGNIMFLHEINMQRNGEGNSLRDKAVSFGFGLEMSSAERPNTCIGIHNVGNTYDKYGDLGSALKGSLPDIKALKVINNEDQLALKSFENDVNDNAISTANGNVVPNQLDTNSKAIKFNTTHDFIGNKVNGSSLLDSIPYADAVDVHDVNEDFKNTNENSNSLDDKPNECTTVTPKLPLKMRTLNATNDTGLVEAINFTLIKSQHKTTDINLNVADNDKPPEIGPRKEFLKKFAPKPPPRPSKAAELVQRKFDLLKMERMNNNNTEKHHLHIPELPEPNKEINTPTSSLQRVSNINNEPSVINANLTGLSPCHSHRQQPLSLPIPPKPHGDDHSEETELLTPNRTKTLTLKKKNSILAKRRKLCLKTLEISDIQGHLFRRMKDKHGVTYWAKYYFVMVETALYGFRSKRSQKASCLIFLTGFTVSLAKEVHSKQFAYKVYHPKKTFYFAAETEQALGQWMEYIRRAILKGSAAPIDSMQVDNVNTRDLFSETDSSEDENEIEDAPQLSTFKHALLGGSRSKKRGSVDETSSTTSKSEKYHLGFGSLKKLTNLHNLPFTSSKTEKDRDERKKAQSDIPVPTAQFRSYRKIPGNAGMQLGSSSIIDYNILTQRLPQTNVLNSSSLKTTIQEEKVLPKSCEIQIKPSPQKVDIVQPVNQRKLSSPPVPIKNQTNSPKSSPSTILQHKTPEHQHMERKPISKLAKTKTSPFNYMHASNPNLVEFTFQTSKTLDVGLPKVNASSSFDPHQNPQNMITLKDLMLQREEDEAHNMYNNRVNLGVEKQNDRQKKIKPRRSNDTTSNETNRINDENENTPQNGQKPGVNKIQSRSLPKTPDYAQSFKTDDSEIIMARSKEGQKLRDFGYEFISGDDVTNSNNQIKNINVISSQFQSKKPIAQPKPNDRFLLTSKRKGLNWIGLTSDKRNDDERLSNKGSFKLNKHKVLDAFEPTRSKNETHRPVLNRFTQINKLDNETFVPASSLDHRTDSISSMTNADRRPSTASTVQTSYLSKLTFPTSKNAKEKRLLGSPRLHRAASSLFGRKTSDASILDHEIFSPINETFQSKYFINNDCLQQTHSNTNNSNYMTNSIFNDAKSGANKNACVESSHLTTNIPSDGNHDLIPPTCPTLMNQTTDQPIQYPPVFEPETYSLCDPHASLKLIRRRTVNRNNNTNNNDK